MFNVHTPKTVNHGFFQAVKTKIDIFDIHTFRRQSKIHFERTFEILTNVYKSRTT